jgi:hypothetical protein
MKSWVKFFAVLFLFNSFSMEIQAKTPPFKEVILNGNYSTSIKLNDKGEVLLHYKGTFYQYSPEQAALDEVYKLPGKSQIESYNLKFTHSGIIQGSFEQSQNAEEGDSDESSKYFVYYPDKGEFFVLDDEMKNALKAKGLETNFWMDVFETTDSGLVIGEVTIFTNCECEDFRSYYWTFDRQNRMSFLDFNPSEIAFKSANSRGDILFYDEQNTDFIVYNRQKKIVHHKDLGMRNLLSPFNTYVGYTLDNDDIKATLNDVGVIAGTIDRGFEFQAGTHIDEYIDDGSLVFVYYPEGTLYVSGISDFIEKGVDVLLDGVNPKDNDYDGPHLFYANQVVLNNQEFAFVTGNTWPLFISKKKGKVTKIQLPREFVNKKGSRNPTKDTKLLDLKFNLHGNLQVLGVCEECISERDDLFAWDNQMGVQYLSQFVDLQGIYVFTDHIQMNSRGDIVFSYGTKENEENDEISIIILYRQ